MSEPPVMSAWEKHNGGCMGGERAEFVLFNMEWFEAANSVVWLPFLYLYHSGCKVPYKSLFRGFLRGFTDKLVFAVLHVRLFFALMQWSLSLVKTLVKQPTNGLQTECKRLANSLQTACKWMNIHELKSVKNSVKTRVGVQLGVQFGGTANFLIYLKKQMFGGTF